MVYLLAEGVYRIGSVMWTSSAIHHRPELRGVKGTAAETVRSPWGHHPFG